MKKSAFLCVVLMALFVLTGPEELRAQVANPAGFVSGTVLTASQLNTTFGALAGEAEPSVAGLPINAGPLASDRITCYRASASAFFYCGPGQIVSAGGGLLAANNLSDVPAPATARGAIGAAASGSNGDITALSGLTTPLSIGEGGTGAGSAPGALASLGGVALAGSTMTGALQLGSTTNGINLGNTGVLMQYHSGGGVVQTSVRTDTLTSSSTTLANDIYQGVNTAAAMETMVQLVSTSLNATAGAESSQWSIKLFGAGVFATDFYFNAGAEMLAQGAELTFASTATADTSISRTAAGVIAVGNGVQGNASGVVNAAVVNAALNGNLGATTPAAVTATTLKWTTAVTGPTGNLLGSATAPTLTSGFGASPSISATNGTEVFVITVGTGGTGATGVVAMPAATTGWACDASDITTTSTAVALTKETANTSTSVTLGNLTSSFASGAWAAGDRLLVKCKAF